jgi:lipopolysaccharide transport system ATP-binding protein
MSEVAGEGRTVLFVSHNMDAVRRLCGTVVWLEDGQVRLYDRVSTVIDAYLATVEQPSDAGIFPVMSPEYGIGFEDCQVTLEPNPTTGALDLRMALTINSEEPLPRIGIGFGLTAENGSMVASLGGKLTGYTFDMQPGTNHFTAEIPAISQVLTTGDYMISLWLSMPSAARILYVEHAALISVPGVDLYGTGRFPDIRKHGPVLLPLVIREVEHASL